MGLPGQLKSEDQQDWIERGSVGGRVMVREGRVGWRSGEQAGTGSLALNGGYGGVGSALLACPAFGKNFYSERGWRRDAWAGATGQ